MKPMNLATSKEEFRQMADRDEFLIKNPIDAANAIKKHFEEKLSDDDILSFVKTCKFKKNALAGCTYKMIKDKLTLPDYHNFFELFGIHRVYLAMIEDFHCPPVGVCKYAPNEICTGMCGGPGIFH